jgi:hypothetical protein
MKDWHKNEGFSRTSVAETILDEYSSLVRGDRKEYIRKRFDSSTNEGRFFLKHLS